MGAQGVVGQQGLPGAQGLQGVDGLQGPSGSVGIQGVQGQQGAPGSQGSQGVQGLQGVQGPEGIGNSLDNAYDEGGLGDGRTIFADSGPVEIAGPDGLVVSGSVGIGTGGSGEALNVAGNAHVSGTFIAGNTTTYGDGFIALSTGTDLNIDSNTLFVDNANNRVGIGTTSPFEELDVTSTSNPGISLTSTTTGGAQWSC